MFEDPIRDSIQRALDLAAAQQVGKRSAQGPDFQKYIIDKYLALEEAKTGRHSSFLGSWTTPLAIAVTGLITIGANLLSDQWKSSSAAAEDAKAARLQFQYKILETELNSNRNEIDRAKVILFLVKIGVLTELREDELKAIAQAVIPGDTKIGVPALTPTSVRDLALQSGADETIRLLSDEGIKLIVKYEAMNETTYVRVSKSRPYIFMPRGGINIGFSYDLGFVSPAQFEADWSTVLPPGDLAALKQAAGIKGEEAKTLMAGLPSGLTISYEQAVRSFVRNTVVQYAAQLASRLPESKKLSPDCFSSILSIAIWRGLSFSGPMRPVEEAIVQGREQDLPALIRAMSIPYLPPERKEDTAKVCEHKLL